MILANFGRFWLQLCICDLFIFLSNGLFNADEAKNVLYSIQVNPDQPLNRESTLLHSSWGDPVLKKESSQLPSPDGQSSSPETSDVSQEGVDESSKDAEDEDLISREETFILSSQRGQEFLCKFPRFVGISESEAKRDSVARTNITSENITLLLESSFKLRKCLKKTVGWWTYEFCYGEKVSQYHLEGKEVSGKILVLGNFENDAEYKESTTSSEKKLTRYHSQRYTNGTLCDLNSRLRTTEVRFYCEEDLGPTDAYLYRVDEPETCQYLLSVHVGSLCSLRQFLPADRPLTPQAVTCHPLLSADQYQIYMEAKKEKEEREKELREKLEKELEEGKKKEEEQQEEVEEEEVEEKRKDLEKTEKLMETMQAAMVQDLDKMGIKYQLKTIMVDASELVGGKKKIKKLSPALPEQETLATAVKKSDKPDSQLHGERWERLMNIKRRAAEEEEKKKAAEKNEGYKDDEEMVEDFGKKLEEEDLTGKTVDKQKLKTGVEQNFDDIISEAEQELKDSGVYGRGDQADKNKALKALTESLRKLLDSFDQSMKKKEEGKGEQDKKKIPSPEETVLEEKQPDGGDSSEEAGVEEKQPDGGDSASKETDDEEKQADAGHLSDKREEDIPTKSGQIKIKRLPQGSKQDKTDESGRGVLGRDEGVKVRVSRIKTQGLPESWWAGGLRSRCRSTSADRQRSTSLPLNWRSKSLTCSIVDLKNDDLRNDLNARGKITSETQRIEEQLATKLKSAGFKPGGGAVQVKIITSGYFDDQKEEFHILDAAESDQFTKLLINMLGGESEESKEVKRHRSLQEGYYFDWEEAVREMQTENEDSDSPDEHVPS